jgi:hypothetical protein
MRCPRVVHKFVHKFVRLIPISIPVSILIVIVIVLRLALVLAHKESIRIRTTIRIFSSSLQPTKKPALGRYGDCKAGSSRYPAAILTCSGPAKLRVGYHAYVVRLTHRGMNTALNT